MPVMRSRRRTLTCSAAVFVAVLLVSALYLRIGIFPGRLREGAIRNLERWTHKKVTFDRAVFIPFHGLSLTHVAVFEPDGEPLFQARRVTLNARLLPFFREKKILVNRLLLDGARTNWVLEPGAETPAGPPPKTVISGQIEVPVVPENKPPALKDLQYGPDFFLPENVYIERIEIAGGTVTIRKHRGEEPVETLRSVNMRLTMPKAPVLRFEGRIEIGQTPYASIDAAGSWDLRQDRYDFQLRARSSDVPGWLIDYQQGHFLILREGGFSLETRIWSGSDSAMLFHTKAELSDAVFKLNEARYSGRLKLEAEGEFDGASKRFTKYRGKLELVDVDAKNVSKKIDALDQLTGTLLFEPDLLNVQALHGRYQDIAFDASGTLRSFQDLVVDGDVRTRLSMDQMRAMLPAEYRDKWRDFTLTGDCETHTLLSGSLRRDSKVETEYELVIRDGALRNEAKKIAWTDLSGRLRLSGEGTHIEALRFTASEKTVTLSAFIPKNAGDPGSLSLRSPDFSVEAATVLQGSDVLLRNGRATFTSGSASFSGKCLHWTDPWLELEGRAHLDLGFLAPASLGLQGVLSGPFTLSGVWDRPSDWDFKMDAGGSPVYWKNLHLLEDFEMQVRMKNRRLDMPYIHANSYGGTVGCQLRVDLTRPAPRFETQLYLNNLDLSRVPPAALPWLKQPLKGTLIAKLSLEGTLADASTVRGEGALSITDGLLWQTSRFRDMGNLPLVRVEGLDWVTFEGLSATFEVQGRKLHTEDLTLLGDSVDLSLDGTIGFDGNLDLVMDIRYSDAVMQGASLTGGFVPLVVQQAGNAISQYRIGGTLNEPKSEKMLLPTGRAMGRKLTGVVQGLAA